MPAGSGCIAGHRAKWLLKLLPWSCTEIYQPRLSLAGVSALPLVTFTHRAACQRSTKCPPAPKRKVVASSFQRHKSETSGHNC